MSIRTPLLEAFIKHIQDISEMDKFLETFKEKYVFNNYEEIEKGLTAYDNIPYNKAFIFPFAT